MAEICPDLERLAAYQHRRLPLQEEEAVERHCAACADCRQALLLAIRAGDMGPSPAAWIWRAAAGLLIVAAGWLAWKPEPQPQPAPPAPPAAKAVASRPAIPEGLLGAASPCGYLAPGVDLLLSAGARVRSEGSRLRGESGRFWLEASGSPVTLALPGGELLLEEGALAVSVTPVRASVLFREALAGEEAPVQVWVLRGEASLRVQGVAETLTALQKLEIGPLGFQALPFPESKILELARERALAAAAVPGRALAEDLPVPPAWRWVTVLSARSEGTEVGLSFGMGEAWHRWTAGLGGTPPAGQEVLELTWDGERLVGRLDGIPRFSATRDQARQLLGTPDSPRWGISVWGGAATVVSSVLQEGGTP